MKVSIFDRSPVKGDGLSNPNSLKDTYSFGSGSGLGVGFCSDSVSGFGCQTFPSSLVVVCSTISNSDCGVFPAMGSSSTLVLLVTVLSVIRVSFVIGIGASVKTESGFGKG